MVLWSCAFFKQSLRKMAPVPHYVQIQLSVTEGQQNRLSVSTFKNVLN